MLGVGGGGSEDRKKRGEGEGREKRGKGEWGLIESTPQKLVKVNIFITNIIFFFFFGNNEAPFSQD